MTASAPPANRSQTVASPSEKTRASPRQRLITRRDLVIIVVTAVLTLVGSRADRWWESRREDRNGNWALMLERDRNIKVAKYDVGLLREDLVALKDGQSLVTPLLALDQSMWAAVVRSDLILDGGLAFTQPAENLYDNIYLLNERIRLRETFRLTCRTSVAFNDDLAKIDGMVLSDAEQVLAVLEDSQRAAPRR